MSGPITPILWCWAALSPLLFRVLPGRDAAIACLVAGWAILPTADQPPSALVDGGSSSTAHAITIAAPPHLNKATAIGLGGLVGLALFDRRTFIGLRLTAVDLPMLSFCLVPLASTAANHLPVAEGLVQVRHLALAWGVPYLLGRAYLIDEPSRGRFIIGLAAAGLAYVPICLLELVAGPVVYRFAYGPHPYEFEGAARFLGSRPLGFQEHGNQLGMWMASSALAATWAWASGAVKAPGRIPGVVLSAVLVGMTLLCQSHGSIILLALVLSILALARSTSGRFPWRWAALAVLGACGLASIAVAGRWGFDPQAIRGGLSGFFKGIDKSSFNWRLARAVEFFPTALRHPWFGRARPDWRADGLPFVNPVNLSIWLHCLGMYGLTGLTALMTTWLLPLIHAARQGSGRLTGASRGASGALTALVAINFLDSFSNSVILPPILAAIGSLTQPSVRASDRPKTG